MITNWAELAPLVPKNENLSKNQEAKKALEMILGSEWLENSVDYVLNSLPNYELTLLVLRQLRSEKATLYACSLFHESNTFKQTQIVWLLKHISHPIVLNWIEEFMAQPHTAQWAIGILDDLISSGLVNYHSVSSIIEKAKSNPIENVKELARRIYEYAEDEI